MEINKTILPAVCSGGVKVTSAVWGERGSQQRPGPGPAPRSAWPPPLLTNVQPDGSSCAICHLIADSIKWESAVYSNLVSLDASNDSRVRVCGVCKRGFPSAAAALRAGGRGAAPHDCDPACCRNTLITCFNTSPAQNTNLQLSADWRPSCVDLSHLGGVSQ